MKLNKGHCEAINTGETVRINFSDGTAISDKQEVKYLGCVLNKHTNTRNDIKKNVGSIFNVEQTKHVLEKRKLHSKTNANNI